MVADVGEDAGGGYVEAGIEVRGGNGDVGARVQEQCDAAGGNGIGNCLCEVDSGCVADVV